MKGAEVRTVVRVPIEAVVGELAEVHSIKLPLAAVSIDDGYIRFEFGGASTESKGGAQEPPSADRSTGDVSSPAHVGADSSSIGNGGSKRAGKGARKRRSAKRNRMRTRGWNVVTKLQNARGQTVTIYHPFVDALRDNKDPRRKKEQIVREILRANGNVPGPESVRYYLENTLEYLARPDHQ